jgi:hypothetical protein
MSIIPWLGYLFRAFLGWYMAPIHWHRSNGTDAISIMLNPVGLDPIILLRSDAP